MNVSDCCQVVLADFNTDQKSPLEDERDIATLIRQCINQSPLPADVLAELYAFSLMEDSRHGQTHWGTYFGPQAAQYENGAFSEEIPLEKITSEVVTHWEKRIGECTNPILLARYAGLVWEFKSKVGTTRPDFKKVGIVYMKNLLRSTQEGSFIRPTLVFRKLGRGLSLCVQYNQPALKKEAIQQIINYEQKVGSISKPGYWRFSYDLIAKGFGVNADEETLMLIITRMKQRLDELVAKAKKEKIDINHIWEYTERLSEHYRSKDKYDEIKLILTDLSTAVNDLIENCSAVKAIHLLEKLRESYKENKFDQEAESILIKIQELGPKMIEEMKTSRVELKISNQEIEKIVALCLTGDTRSILNQISIGLIPRKDAVLNFSGGAALFNSITKTIHDVTGRTVSKVGPISEDETGNFVYQLAQTLTIYSIYLRNVLAAATNRSLVTIDEIMTLVKNTPLVKTDKYNIIKKAIDAYFQNDYIIFLHLIVPQIEAMCLRIIEVNKGNIWRETKGGTFHVRVFDDILRDDLFINVVGEGNAVYLRAIFTEQRGWNVRNIISHGLSSEETFTSAKADRILAVLLQLCLLNPEPPVVASQTQESTRNNPQ